MVKRFKIKDNMKTHVVVAALCTIAMIIYVFCRDYHHSIFY